MKLPQLKSPYHTTNLYVRKKIIQENIIELTAFIFSDDYRNLSYLQKDEIRKQKDSQISLLYAMEKNIADVEQLAFHFGLPIQ